MTEADYRSAYCAMKAVLRSAIADINVARQFGLDENWDLGHVMEIAEALDIKLVENKRISSLGTYWELSIAE